MEKEPEFVMQLTIQPKNPLKTIDRKSQYVENENGFQVRYARAHTHAHTHTHTKGKADFSTVGGHLRK